MIVKAFCIIVAFPSTTILLTNSCTSLRALSTLNGFATMFSGLGRAIGPASTGLVFSWGAKNGYIISAYYFLGLIAAIGAIPVFMIEEGDGPTASTDASDTEDDTMQDSGVIIPDESAVEDEEDEDASASVPLLKNDRSSNYKAIERT